MRATFSEHVAADLTAVAPQLYFIDESGTHLGLTWLYGRAGPGERVVEATPGFSGPHYTVIAALSLRGVSAPFVFEGSMNAPTFETYVAALLAPSLRPRDIVITRT